MTKQILFFQGGGGQADHEADSRLVESLVKNLGPDYHVRYPLLEDDGTPDLGRRKQIGRVLNRQKAFVSCHQIISLPKFVDSN